MGTNLELLDLIRVFLSEIHNFKPSQTKFLIGRVFPKKILPSKCEKSSMDELFFVRNDGELNRHLVFRQRDGIEGVAAVGGQDPVGAAAALVVRPERDAGAGRAALVAPAASSALGPVAGVGQPCRQIFS
jgi:hypothetical protein